MRPLAVTIVLLTSLVRCADAPDPPSILRRDAGSPSRDSASMAPTAMTGGDDAADGGLIAAGRASVERRGCPGCHQSDDPADGELSGASMPAPGSRDGVVAYGPNLTPDVETGLGSWTDAQIVRAMRMAVDDQGARLCVMPSFDAMGDDEAAAIVAYLRSLPAISRATPDSTCPWDLDAVDADAGLDAAADHEAGNGDEDNESGNDGGGGDTGDDATDAGAPDASDAGSGPCAPSLVINEVQTGGDGGAGDEFVEVYNASGCAASLAGVELRYAASEGATAARRWVGGPTDAIGPRGHVFIAGAGFSGREAPLGWFSGSAGVLAAAGGGLGLYDASGARVDSVGYGSLASNPLVESRPAAAPGASSSIGRSPDGHDTDDNGADFVVATSPSPGRANH